MEVREMINKWFEDTRNLLDKKIDKDTFRSSDGVSLAALNAAEDYCNAILLLLNGDYVLPAGALLRCLCELMVKLSWCLSVSDDKWDERDLITEGKIKGWEKSTLKENVNTLTFYSSIADENHKEELNKTISDLKKKSVFNDDKIVEMPPFRKVVEQLPPPFMKKVYPLLYKQFNNLVHLDVTSLVDFSLDENNLHSKDLKKYCIDLAFHVNSVIRMNYDIDVNLLKDEYHKIQNSF